MSDKFSDDKAPHQGEFQQSCDRNYNAPPYYNILPFKEPNSRNLCGQHSERSIPSQNRSISLSQLPPPPLPPPPPPPRLVGPVFNAGNMLSSESYSHPPPSNYPPSRPISYTGTDFSISPRQFNLPNPRQPNLQNLDFSKPPPPRLPFTCPTQNLLIRQPTCEVNNQPKSLEGSVISANNEMRDMNSDKDEFYIQNWVSNVKRRLDAEENFKKTKEIKVQTPQF